MAFDWSALGTPSPAALAPLRAGARELAARAVELSKIMLASCPVLEKTARGGGRRSGWRSSAAAEPAGR